MNLFGLRHITNVTFAGIVLLAVFIFFAPSTEASINPQINFQGKLTNSDGTNVTNGTYSIIFSIYSVPTGGAATWTETQSSVAVSDGIFRVSLGSITSLPGSVDFNSNAIYLGIKVGADPEMLPRVQFTAAPYAFNSDRLDGLDSTAFGQLSATNAWAGANSFAGNTSLGSVGTATAASTIHVADTSDGTGTQLVTIGSTAKTANITTIQGGGAGSTIILQTAASGGIDIGVNNVASKTINIGSVGSTAQSTTVHVADSTGAAQTVTIGSGSTTSTTTIQAGSGNLNLSPSAGNDVVFSQAAGSNFQVSASAVPTVDQLAISNAGQGVTAASVNGLSINYVGGAANVESSGARIDLTPGSTSGGIWSGLRIVANATGPVSGVTAYGIKVEGPTAAGAGIETGMYIGTGWDTGLDVQSGGLNLAGYSTGGVPSDPATPAANNLKVYAKEVSGRMLLKIKGPSGIDTPIQTALFGNNVVLFAPASGTTGTGTGFGTAWQSNGTVSHPTPVTTAPAIANQIKHTRYANIATTQNQVLGPKANAASEAQFWRGNAAGLGGFFFMTRFKISLWPAATVRLFTGLSSSTTGVVASNTVSGDVVGLWHDTTDSATTLSFVTRNNTTTTKTAITGVPTLAANQVFDFYMFAAPNDSTIYYRLTDVNTGTVIVDSSTSTTLPRNTIFMGPQVQMSNGTANTTVTTTAIGVNRVYIESDN